MRREASRADCTAGSSRATKTPMIAITTSSSTSVKARRSERPEQRAIRTSQKQSRSKAGERAKGAAIRLTHGWDGQAAKFTIHHSHQALPNAIQGRIGVADRAGNLCA